MIVYGIEKSFESLLITHTHTPHTTYWKLPTEHFDEMSHIKCNWHPNQAYAFISGGEHRMEQ